MYKNFVVQAFMGFGGWVDTIYQGDTFEEARQEERKLLENDESWMPGKRETRIVPKELSNCYKG